MSAPLLSVVLPAYNAEAYLESAVQSVLQQSFENFELIVIDDGSEDRTAAILEKIDDRRLRVIRHERNAGLIAGLNEGVATATGKFIARMDADDICEPSRFHRQIECLETHPEIGVLGTAVKVIDEQGRLGVTFVMPVSSLDVEWAMPLLCPVAHPSVMMRTDLVRRVGGYSSAARHAEDYDLWHRLSGLTQVANLRAPLLRLRKHAASVTSAQRDVHLDAATAVAQAVIHQRLNEEVPAAVIRCLRSWGQTDSTFALQAAQLLSRLLKRLVCARPRPSSGRARRDAAIRIAYLARHVTGSRERVQLLREAHSAYPLVLPAIARKTLLRFAPGATRDLIG